MDYLIDTHTASLSSFSGIPNMNEMIFLYERVLTEMDMFISAQKDSVSKYPVESTE
jgi:hypothetical protein